jgi:hypothetical protein
MPFIEAPTSFYLGRRYDPEAAQMADEVVYYDSRDLTTHAVVVGMTGSGKTGMCIALLEEALLDGIPAIVIDPKGDITNLLLQFPELRPEDFEPWVNPSDAQRAGMEIGEYASEVAQQWRDGLAGWSITSERMQKLKDAAQYSIYTPGSDAGLPISILASLQAPREGWIGHEEFHREQISGIVRALLALVGKQVDPVKDREHVLIANIFEEAWKYGKDLTLEDIILQVQNPPFTRLGVFDINTFFPERDRFRLAKELNNIIASPSFQTWITGEPLDMRNLLYMPDGRPHVSIFYLAHLTDAERTFIITLILENVLAWMRALSGTTSLRAILYFDEVFGHFPPHPRNPPTKEPLLRLLKTGRAFGVGTVLATQNPGDLDYKGLSNAGTWLIGKLQTENDKRRVLGGLESAATADTGLDVRTLDQLISGLAPRVFVLHNVHQEGGPILVHSRWAMSYLRGPLTRQQVRLLMEDQRRQLEAGLLAPAPQAAAPARPTASDLPIQPRAKLHVEGAFMRPPLPGEAPPAPVTPPASLASRGATPPPAVLPEQHTGTTPVPPVLPEQAPAGSPRPPAPPDTDQGSGGAFLDRLVRETPPPAPPEQPDESRSFRPSSPFQFVQKSAPPQPAPEPPAEPNATEPAPGSSAFWMTPDAPPLPAEPPPAQPPSQRVEPVPQPPQDGTVGLGHSYARPSLPGTGTQPGPALPPGYASRPPALPSSVPQLFLPPLISTAEAIRAYEQQNSLRSSAFGGAQMLYRPVFLAQVGVRFLDRKTGADGDQQWAFHVPNVDGAGFVRWNDFQAQPVPANQIANEPYGVASYGELTPGLSDPKRLRELRDEVVDYVARSAQLILFYNATLKLYSQVGEELRDFLARMSQIAREKLEEEANAIANRYNRQLDALEQRLARFQRRHTSDREVLDELRREDLYTTGEAVMSLLRGRTAYTLSRMSRARRYKKQAQERTIASEHEITDIEAQIEATELEFQRVLVEAKARWERVGNSYEEYAVKPLKKDVAIEAYGLGWVPQWYVVLNNAPVTLPAFPEGLVAG